jgi:polysaccharide export outer membrane protein
MVARRLSLTLSACLTALLVGGCSHHLMLPSQLGLGDYGSIMPLPAPLSEADRQRSDFTDIGYATWTEDEPSYRVYPGDEIEVTVPSAPELSKTQIVPPDGRLTMPLIGPVMAADKELPQLQAILTQAYSSQLLRPQVNVALKTAGPLKVYVGGEVNNPGMYDMAGDGDALRAIIQAGGFKNTGAQNQVVVIRRSGDGHPMMRTTNLGGGLRGRGGVSSDLVPLRRFDIVYVPRTSAAEAAQFVQTYFRDLSPIQFGFTIPLSR